MLHAASLKFTGALLQSPEEAWGFAYEDFIERRYSVDVLRTSSLKHCCLLLACKG